LTFTALDASGTALASETASFDAPSCDTLGHSTAVVSAFLPVDPKRLPSGVAASLEGKLASTLKLPDPVPGDLKFTDSPAQDELVAGVRAIAWVSESPDPSDERHSVWYSADGIAWIPLDVNVLDGKMTVDFAALPGSKQAQLRIGAARGAAVTETRTPTFVVSTPAVRVSVTRPAETIVVGPGQPLRAEARASRPAGGPVADPSAYTWSSDLDGPLGTGWACTVRLKQTGTHVLSVAVSQDGDSTAETAPAKVNVTRPVTSFIHTATSENTAGEVTRLAHAPTHAERTVPDARVCFDPFHVVQLGSRATDQVRRAEYNKHGRSGSDTGKWIKGVRYSLLKDPAKQTTQQLLRLCEVQQTNKHMFRAALLYGELRYVYKVPKDQSRGSLSHTRRTCRSRRP
jgi:hypothetical protein